MKEDAGGDELREGPGGRFAKQLADAPEEPDPSGRGDSDLQPGAETGGRGDVQAGAAAVVAGPRARSRAKGG